MIQGHLDHDDAGIGNEAESRLVTNHATARRRHANGARLIAPERHLDISRRNSGGAAAR